MDNFTVEEIILIGIAICINVALLLMWLKLKQDKRKYK